MLSPDNHLHVQLHLIACLPRCDDIASLSLCDAGHLKTLSLKLVPVTNEHMVHACFTRVNQGSFIALRTGMGGSPFSRGIIPDFRLGAEEEISYSIR